MEKSTISINRAISQRTQPKSDNQFPDETYPWLFEIAKSFGIYNMMSTSTNKWKQVHNTYKNTKNYTQFGKQQFYFVPT